MNHYNTKTYNMKNYNILDKIKGLLVGGAMGDALGLPYEVYKKDIVYSGKLNKVSKRYMRFQKKYKLTDIGQVSDDTEMSMCILNSLRNNNMIYDSKNTVMLYMEWANTGCGMGNNTRKLFKGIKTYNGYKKRYDKFFKDIDYKNNMQSNGALMRCGILSLLYRSNETDYLEVIRQDCYLTNPNMVSNECNIILTTMIRKSLKTNDKKIIIVDILKNIESKSVIEYVNYALNQKYIKVNDRKNKGWCVIALYITIYSFLNFDSYQDSIDYIIKENGDTDTNACIAGYLLGAFYGFNVMNKNERFKDNYKIMMECTTKNATKPRPSKYLVKNYITEDNIEKLV